jgi:hypothetical protein
LRVCFSEKYDILRLILLIMKVLLTLPYGYWSYHYITFHATWDYYYMGSRTPERKNPSIYPKVMYIWIYSFRYPISNARLLIFKISLSSFYPDANLIPRITCIFLQKGLMDCRKTGKISTLRAEHQNCRFETQYCLIAAFIYSTYKKMQKSPLLTLFYIIESSNI